VDRLVDCVRVIFHVARDGDVMSREGGSDAYGRDGRFLVGEGVMVQAKDLGNAVGRKL
jgi:hypothetical protein